MANEFKNKGPIYTTAAKYEIARENGTLEIGREYKIVDWEAQEKLVSGESIKTINSQSILGYGDIELSCAEYTIIKDNDKYYLAKDGTKIDTSVIDIPKDLVVESGKLVDHEIEGVTKKCIEITFNDSSKDKIYIPVDELVDTYTGSDTINITNNVISVNTDKIVTTDTEQTITGKKTFAKDIILQSANGSSYGAFRANGANELIISDAKAIYFRNTNEGAQTTDHGFKVEYTNQSGTETNTLKPETNKGLSLGLKDYQWNNIYAETIYQNGEPVQNEITESNKLLYNLIDGTPDLSSYITKEVSDLTNYKVEDRKITLGSNSIDIPEIKNAEGTAITEIQTETVSDILGVVSVVEENNTNIVTSGGVYDAIKKYLGKCLPEFPEDKTKSYSLKLIPENGKLKLTWVADTTINDI